MECPHRFRFLFIFVLCCIAMPSALTSDSVQGGLFSDRYGFDKSKNGLKRDREAMVAGSGARGGGHGGESSGGVENGDSNSNGAGAGVIPAYAAAGAAKNHNNGHQRGGGSQVRVLGLPLIAIIMASAVSQVYVASY